ncbi:MAG TPA: slipin family protein, partial [bacterium]|nr:slipin family protein [bacterium]
EYQASEKLVAAARKLSEVPIAIQLRYLQTASEIATEKNSTLVFPIPLEMFSVFKQMAEKKADQS